jgi:hypothetical protein
MPARIQTFISSSAKNRRNKLVTARILDPSLLSRFYIGIPFMSTQKLPRVGSYLQASETLAGVEIQVR